MTEIKEFETDDPEAGPSGYEIPSKRSERAALVDKMQVKGWQPEVEGRHSRPAEHSLAGHQTRSVHHGAGCRCFIISLRSAALTRAVLRRQPVIVHGRPCRRRHEPRTAANNHRPGVVPMEHRVMIGLSPAKAPLVNPGDIISFAQMPFDLSGETVAGHTMMTAPRSLPLPSACRNRAAFTAGMSGAVQPCRKRPLSGIHFGLRTKPT